MVMPVVSAASMSLMEVWSWVMQVESGRDSVVSVAACQGVGGVQAARSVQNPVRRANLGREERGNFVLGLQGEILSAGSCSARRKAEQ